MNNFCLFYIAYRIFHFIYKYRLFFVKLDVPGLQSPWLYDRLPEALMAWPLSLSSPPEHGSAKAVALRKSAC